MNEITTPFRYNGKGFCVESAADPLTKMVMNVVSRDAFGGEENAGTEHSGSLVYKIEKPFTTQCEEHAQIFDPCRTSSLYANTTFAKKLDNGEV